MFWLLPWALTTEVALFIILIFMVELEKFGWATTLMVGSIIIYSILGHFFKWPKISSIFVRENFWLVLKYIGYYVAGAILWSYGKWVVYLWNFRRTRDKSVEEFKQRRLERPELYTEVMTIETIRSMLGHERYKRSFLSATPKAKEYKGMIVAWAVWWPASVIGTIVDDPVRKFINLMFDLFSGLYQKAADKIVPEIRL